MLTVCLALYISISRVRDYRHDNIDIIIGGLIGLFCSTFCYKLYYPKLDDENCMFSNRQVKWLEKYRDLEWDNSENMLEKSVMVGN